MAITHAGMNSTSDLLYNNVPFVAISIRADQHYMAGRASELGAAISLDKDNITPEILKNSVTCFYSYLGAYYLRVVTNLILFV